MLEGRTVSWVFRRHWMNHLCGVLCPGASPKPTDTNRVFYTTDPSFCATMTDSRSEALQALSREFCTCGVCGETSRDPRSLPCFHSFCSGCLNTHIAQEVNTTGQNYFPCPDCARTTSVLRHDVSNESNSEAADDSGADDVIKDYASMFKQDTFICKLTEVIEAFKEGKSCDICHRREITQPADNWCMDCSDAVCENCTKVHLCGRTTADHVIISLTELRRLNPENVLKRGSAHNCPQHSQEVVSFYCLDCRLPVCVQCFSISHRKCENCLPLPEAMKSREEEVAEVMVKIRGFGSDVTANGGEEQYESGADVLEDSVKKAEETIRSLAEEMRQRIERSEEELLERLHSVSLQLQDKVGDFRNTPGSRSDDLKTLSAAGDRMEALLKYGSDVEVLDVFHVIKDAVSRLEGTSTSASSSSTNLTDDEVRLKVNFDPDESARQFCRTFEKLGEIRVEDCNTDDGLSAWGVAVTARDDIIVVDCRSKRVQKFSNTGDLLDHIQISEEPRDVGSCGDSSDEVAITILKKQIFLVTVGGVKTMGLKRKIQTPKQYDGISSSPQGEQFLVSCLEENCVDVISFQGEVIKTFAADRTVMPPIFDNPRYVVCTKDGNYVISDVTKSVVTCLRKDGSVVFSYSPTGSHEIKKAQGVCCDRLGNLFVADYANCRVHLITSDGTFQRLVLGRESGVRRPVALAMSHKNKLVLVQSDGMVKIFSYDSMKVKLKVPCWCPRCLSSSESHDSSADGLSDGRGGGGGGRGGVKAGSSQSQGQGVESPGGRRERGVSVNSVGGSVGSVGSDDVYHNNNNNNNNNYNNNSNNSDYRRYGNGSRSGSESFGASSPSSPTSPLARRSQY
ncbi:uncharacterized protein LOC101851691 [Aplysia californica]|uniref:Uncharacterized protein LOC101851691 n=1 Tax=Aplysia californica TaxID=6500 RepID=A0ABM0K9F6_APLCA|nr:uncharacterized protein LOC101851691 [Aplysia californica]